MRGRFRLSTAIWLGLGALTLCLVGVFVSIAAAERETALRDARWRGISTTMLLAQEFRAHLLSSDILMSLVEQEASGTFLEQPAVPGAVDLERLFTEYSDAVVGALFTERGVADSVVRTERGPTISAKAVADLMRGIARGYAFWLTAPFEDPSTGNWYILVGRPSSVEVTSARVTAVGLVIPLQRFRQFLNSASVGRQGRITVTRLDGTPLLPDPEAEPDPSRAWPEEMLVPPASFADSELTTYRVVEGTPIMVTVTPVREEVLSSWKTGVTQQGVLLAIVLVLINVAGALIARISRRRDAAEADLREKTALLEATLDNMDQGLLLIDADETVPLANRRTAELLDLPADLLAGRPRFREIVEHQIRVGEFGRSSADMQSWVRERGYDDTRHSYERERPNGAWIEVRSVPLPHGGTVRTFTDVTERKRAQGEIERLAHHDTLTGLANRVSLLKELERACHPEDGEPGSFALLCLDLDGFKHVNDTFGHPAGDALLREVGDRLRRISAPDDVIARLGGDEFALLLRNGSAGRPFAEFCRTVVAALSEPYRLDLAVPDITVSGGLALAPADGGDPDVLLRRADLALYEAKAAGRSIVRRFTPSMEEKARRRRRLIGDLETAIQRNQLRLEYQPIFDVDGQQVQAVEALVRWDHPTRGPIPPHEFVPLAEESEQIARLGAWILQEACREAAGWQDAHCVAVNISPMQVHRGDLVSDVRAAVAAAGIAPSRLHIEITETALIRETAETIRTLEELRSLGIRISLDDFGTGFSSLSHLCSFAFDRIKIDRSFIRQATHHHNSRAVVDAVAALGEELGILTTAEGVETDAQLAVVRAAGCTEVQGYLYARPMRPEKLRDFLQERAAVRVA